MRKRRQFTDEFKAGVVALIVDEGRSIGQVSREMDLSESAVRRWVGQTRIERGDGPSGGLSKDERDELTHLRREVRQLRLEREVLKKATAFFARESN